MIFIETFMIVILSILFILLGLSLIIIPAILFMSIATYIYHKLKVHISLIVLLYTFLGVLYISTVATCFYYVSPILIKLNNMVVSYQNVL